MELYVPKSLIATPPSVQLTPVERAVAWEISTILDEMRVEPMEHDDEALVIVVPSARLRGPAGRDDNHHLAKVLDKLASITWNGQDMDGRRYVVSLIAQGDIDPGAGDKVRIIIPPRAVNFLRSPKAFAKLDREVALSLPQNARTLYAVLKDRFANPDKLKRLEAVYSIDEIKGLLQIGGRYPDWHDFKKRVIAPSIDAIQKTGALDVTWEPIKLGRSVTAVRFKLKRKAPDDAAEAERQSQRHSKAKHKTAPDEPDAPPLVEQTEAVAYLISLSNSERSKWWLRAVEIGATKKTKPNQPEGWAGWVASELKTAGLLPAASSGGPTPPRG